MTGNVSKYALIGGKEVTLLESISHASSGEVVCVFEDGSGARRFVSEREWDAGAEEFARYASERRLVTSESPGRDKIALFRSLFRGRDDVYAHGFVKRDGGIGYSPACANEGTRRCPRYTKSKPRAKCADCPNRKFIPVNERAIRDHFKGERDDLRDVMGLYVLTPDCKTRVLVADFDKEGWKRETTLYRDACRAFGLSPAVERSIMLSRGCEQKLIDLAREQGFACIFDDKRNNGAPVKAEFSGTLRDRQQRAADSLLRHTPIQVSWNRCCSISRVLSPGESRSR